MLISLEKRLSRFEKRFLYCPVGSSVPRAVSDEVGLFEHGALDPSGRRRKCFISNQFKRLMYAMIFVVTIMRPHHAGAAEAEELFAGGNAYYEKGEYDKAIEEYEKILNGGYESANVYYNLAGAYLKSGKLGKAVLNYERARLLSPRDADLVANYRFARAMVQEGVTAGKGVWTWRPLGIYSRGLTIDELTWITSCAYLLIILLLFAGALRPAMTRYRTVWFTLLVCLILFNSIVIRHRISDARNGGIIVAPHVDALFGPYDDATRFFSLGEGAKVNVLKTKDEWYKVRRADGKVGWIKADTVEKI